MAQHSMSTSISFRASSSDVRPSRFITVESLCVLGVMLFLALVTVPFLGREGFWVDEVFSAVTAQSWEHMFYVFRTYENNMALYYVLLRIWMVFGNSDYSIRLFSVVFALASIPVFHLLARRLFGKRTALIGDVLLASNPFFIRYASEARCYSLLVFLTILASLIFVAGIQRPRYRTWVCYSTVVAAATYTQYFGILIIGVHVLALMWRDRPAISWRHMATSFVLLLVFLLPLFVLRPAASSAQVDWIRRPNADALFFFSLEFAGGRGAAVFTTLCVASLVALLSLRRSSITSDQRWFLWMAAAWLLAPIAFVFAFSLVVKPIFIGRFLIGCLPGLVLILALAISQFPNWLSGVALILFVSLSLRQSAREGFTHGAAWREAAQFIRTNATDGDAVICYPFFSSNSLFYYLHRDSAPVWMTPINIASGPYLPGGGGRDPDPAFDIVAKLATERRRVWLVITPMFGVGLNRTWASKIKSTLDNGLRRKQTIHYNGFSDQSIDIICFERTAVKSE
jgi:mannosyltransferase